VVTAQSCEFQKGGTRGGEAARCVGISNISGKKCGRSFKLRDRGFLEKGVGLSSPKPCSILTPLHDGLQERCKGGGTRRTCREAEIGWKQQALCGTELQRHCHKYKESDERRRRELQGVS